MIYSKVLEKYYESWSIIDNSYDTLIFEVGEKPTKEHLEQLWSQIEIDIVREKRNQLLLESDFRVVSDYPNRDKWLTYRQQLRDFPSIWVSNMEFPNPPL